MHVPIVFLISFLKNSQRSEERKIFLCTHISLSWKKAGFVYLFSFSVIKDDPINFLSNNANTTDCLYDEKDKKIRKEFQKAINKKIISNHHKQNSFTIKICAISTKQIQLNGHEHHTYCSSEGSYAKTWTSSIPDSHSSCVCLGMTD